MILKPQREDLQIIAFFIGKIAIGLGLVMFIPLIVALCLGENPAGFDFLIAASLALIVGLSMTILCRTGKDLNWTQGMIVVALSWLLAMVFGAIPFYLSGHWRSFLDACFDAMSGFATTGLVLVTDLDHLPLSVNLWRHLIMFIGGQGIVVVVLAFLLKGFSGALKMYVGEAREEKILPNIIQTARFIWLVSIVYFIIGTIVLSLVGKFEGLSWGRAFFHGSCIFMAAFDTGGFSPQSQNMLYYHSPLFELVSIFLMFLGALNFKLHHTIWTGDRKELRRNIEIITFIVTLSIAFFITALALHRLNIYPNAVMLMRRGFFQVFSAHTGTGHTNLYPQQMVASWNSLALVGLIVAMAIGGCVCSTTGGIKLLRIGVLFKALVQDIKSILLSERAIVVGKIHHIKDMILEEKHVRSALTIFLAFLFLYSFGSLMGMFMGYSLLSSLFESTSAAANVGLSCGITSPTMPQALKIVYIFQMWIGRLEFMSVFVLIGFIVSAIKGK
ncbi:MAG: TrkH family potassium uptake protein [Candidatus Omnitrophica bacterium]|nr:TrkH family potassium uptake protein [Candidatus Omnitrophota bacterium]